MLTLAKKINLSDALISELEAFLDKNIDAVDRTAKRCMEKSFSCLKTKSPMMRLAVILFLAHKAKRKYDEMGIPERIYYDTMSDIKIWSDKCGDKGLKNYGWLQNHVKLELFRLGRLQFQLYECKNKTLNYNKLPFSYGDKLIYIHIPEGEKLCRDKCVESLLIADIFFSKFFPEYEYIYFFCESWLLFEGNREFMSADSNIVKFMSLFTICYSLKVDVQAVERIFGKRRLMKRNYPEKTDLQRRAKAYISSGKKLGIGVGTIKLNNPTIIDK